MRRRRGAGKSVADGPPDETYRVYTRAFDVEIRADEIPARLPDISPDQAKGWLRGNDRNWDSAVGRMKALLADQEGELTSLRDRIIGGLRGELADSDLAQTAIGLLIDQSGSMKGESIAAAAATAAWLDELVAGFGGRLEVLGFSTAGWHGGFAYRQWRRAGRPPRPGRLCALMRVIYKAADEPRLRPEASRALLHPDLLRENVDGEAIEWACRRLRERPERRKLLIVLSDGAPVDDATLMHNGPTYLWRHLQATIAEVERAGGIALGAVGIEHRVDELYRNATVANDTRRLPAAAGELLERMLRRTPVEQPEPGAV